MERSICPGEPQSTADRQTVSLFHRASWERFIWGCRNWIRGRRGRGGLRPTTPFPASTEADAAPGTRCGAYYACVLAARPGCTRHTERAAPHLPSPSIDCATLLWTKPQLLWCLFPKVGLKRESADQVTTIFVSNSLLLWPTSHDSVFRNKIMEKKEKMYC